jgi:hypothetical protein
MGIYAERLGFKRVALFFSPDLDELLMGRLIASLRSRNIQILQQTPVESIGFEKATEFFRRSPTSAEAIIGFGGGKALGLRWMTLPLCSPMRAFFNLWPAQSEIWKE